MLYDLVYKKLEPAKYSQELQILPTSSSAIKGAVSFDQSNTNVTNNEAIMSTLMSSPISLLSRYPDNQSRYFDSKFSEGLPLNCYII